MFPRRKAKAPVSIERPPGAKAKGPVPKRLLPPEPKYRDVKVPHEVSAKPTEYTYPVQAMTQESYELEMRRPSASAHLGFRHFLKTRKFDTLTLALSRSGSVKASQFLSKLINPKYKDVDIAVLAQKCGIGFGELMQIWRNDRLTEAMANMFEAAPTVAEHTAIDAQSTKVCCSRCDGAGVIKINKRDKHSWVQCINCSGSGSVRKAGDAKSRQYVFESTGIVKPSAGMSITVNTGTASSVDSVLDEMERATIDVTSEPGA